MRPIFLKDLLSDKEVFWLYRKLINIPLWGLNGMPFTDDSRQYPTSAMLNIVVDGQNQFSASGLTIYGQSLLFRINERLKDFKMEIPTQLDRFWINATFKEASCQWPHDDLPLPNYFSTVLFLSPVWKDQWMGSFFVEGVEFKFSPGSAVIFQSSDIHTGENPSMKCPYIRLTANLMTHRESANLK